MHAVRSHLMDANIPVRKEVYGTQVARPLYEAQKTDQHTHRYKLNRRPICNAPYMHHHKLTMQTREAATAARVGTDICNCFY